MTTVEPERFFVCADNDGDQRLECPVCSWEANITVYPIGDRPHIAADADLGVLLEAARAHIADKHAQITVKRIYEMYFAVPHSVRSFSHWVMDQETRDYIAALPDLDPACLVSDSMAVLLGLPIRVEPGAQFAIVVPD